MGYLRCRGCCRRGCAGSWKAGIKTVFAFVFYFFFLPAGTLFTVAVTITTASQGLKNLCYMLTGSFSFDGGSGPESQVIATKELVAGLGVSIFLGLCFLAFLWLNSRKSQNPGFIRVMPYHPRHEETDFDDGVRSDEEAYLAEGRVDYRGSRIVLDEVHI